MTASGLASQEGDEGRDDPVVGTRLAFLRRCARSTDVYDSGTGRLTPAARISAVYQLSPSRPKGFERNYAQNAFLSIMRSVLHPAIRVIHGPRIRHPWVRGLARYKRHQWSRDSFATEAGCPFS